MKSILHACFISSLVFLAGCVTSNSMVVGNQTFPPRPDDYIIDVYLPVEAPVSVHQSLANVKTLKQVPSGALTIGRIDTSGAPAAGWTSVFNDAKKRARALGGDGLVVSGWGSHMTSIDGYGNANYGKNVSMTVIRHRN